MKRDDTMRLNKAFEEAHSYGSVEFGVLWLRANEAAIDAAVFCGISQNDLKIKTLLSVATLKILRRARQVARPTPSQVPGPARAAKRGDAT